MWKDDELNGFGRILYSKQDLPNPLDPKALNTTILAYEGYFRSSRLDGEGKAIL